MNLILAIIEALSYLFGDSPLKKRLTRIGVIVYITGVILFIIIIIIIIIYVIIIVITIIILNLSRPGSHQPSLFATCFVYWLVHRRELHHLSEGASYRHLIPLTYVFIGAYNFSGLTNDS